MVENTAEEDLFDVKMLGIESDTVRLAHGDSKAHPTLAPGASLTWTGRLEALGRPDTELVTGTIEWRSAENVTSQAAFAAGPIRIEKPKRAADAIVAGEAIYNSVKDLALPLVLAIAAYLFQRAQAKESARAALRREFLVKFQAGAGYLIHVCSALLALRRDVRLARDRLKEGAEGFEPLAMKSLSYYLSMRKRMERVTTEGGGVLLGTRAGEDFVGSCWSHIVQGMREQLGRLEPSIVLGASKAGEFLPLLSKKHDAEDLKSIRDDTLQRLKGRDFSKVPSDNELEIVEALESALSKKQDREDLERARDHLLERWESWLRDARDDEVAFHQVLWTALLDAIIYEINQVYEDWYRSPEAIPDTTIRELADVLAEREPDSPLTKATVSYLAELEDRKKRQDHGGRLKAWLGASAAVRGGS